VPLVLERQGNTFNCSIMIGTKQSPLGHYLLGNATDRPIMIIHRDLRNVIAPVLRGVVGVDGKQQAPDKMGRPLIVEVSDLIVTHRVRSAHQCQSVLHGSSVIYNQLADGLRLPLILAVFWQQSMLPKQLNVFRVCVLYAAALLK
jgi:hypothetical protein